MIKVQVDTLLKKHGRTFYWLAKEAGISHDDSRAVKESKALGINFGMLEKICRALECQPGDVLSFADQKGEKVGGK